MCVHRDTDWTTGMCGDPRRVCRFQDRGRTRCVGRDKERTKRKRNDDPSGVGSEQQVGACASAVTRNGRRMWSLQPEMTTVDPNEEGIVEKNPVVRAGSWGPEQRKKITRNGRQGACDEGGSPNRRKLVHKGRTTSPEMSATVHGALARGTDLFTAPCYIKLTVAVKSTR